MTPEPPRTDATQMHGVRLIPVSGDTRDPSSSITVRRCRIPFDAGCKPIWSHEESGERYASRFAIYPHADGWLVDVDCQGTGRFLVRDGAIDVDWQGGTAADHYLRTLVLAICLELRGVLCLHANVVARDGYAVGLLAPSRAGKSTLTTALVRAGWRLLSDDMAALHLENDRWQVYPSEPALRLWPDVGEYLLGSAYRECTPVHEGFAKRTVPVTDDDRQDGDAVPLRRLYLLDRQTQCTGSISSLAMNGSEAALAVLRNSVLGDAVSAIGVELQRLRSVSGLLATVPVMRLRYPTDLGILDGVTRTIGWELSEAATDGAGCWS